MSVVRMIVVDPEAIHTVNDLVVFQVPENGRAHKLLQRMCDQLGLEHATIEAKKRKSKEEALLEIPITEYKHVT